MVSQLIKYDNTAYQEALQNFAKVRLGQGYPPMVIPSQWPVLVKRCSFITPIRRYVICLMWYGCSRMQFASAMIIWGIISLETSDGKYYIKWIVQNYAMSSIMVLAVRYFSTKSSFQLTKWGYNDQNFICWWLVKYQSENSHQILTIQTLSVALESWFVWFLPDQNQFVRQDEINFITIIIYRWNWWTDKAETLLVYLELWML